MGEKLPSKRNFAKNLGISTITVENAYAQLIAEGYIYSIPKKGYFVSDIHTILPVEQMHPFEEDNGSSSSIDSRAPLSPGTRHHISLFFWYTSQSLRVL